MICSENNDTIALTNDADDSAVDEAAAEKGGTSESEDNCAIMAAQQLDDFLTNGNIKNSVNYPSISMPRGVEYRLVILHKNVPNVISTITTNISAEGINIENMANRSKGDYAVTMVDTPDKVSNDVIAKISATENVIRVFQF